MREPPQALQTYSWHIGPILRRNIRQPDTCTKIQVLRVGRGKVFIPCGPRVKIIKPSLSRMSHSVIRRDGLMSEPHYNEYAGPSEATSSVGNPDTVSK